MATRFYVNTAHFFPESITFDSAWEATGAAVSNRFRMYPYFSGPYLDTRQATETSSTADRDTAIAQFVSPPLQAQTITGTFHGVMQARENNSGANMRSQCVVRVIDATGSVRGTLIAADTSALSNEWLDSTSAWRNARFPVGSSGTSVTSVAALAGDRIVIEAGYRAHNTSSTSFIGTIRIGHGQSSTDLLSNDTDGTSTDNSWFEFSQTLLFDVADEVFADDIGDVVDTMPDPLGEQIYRTSDFSTFTAEAGDPDELDFWAATPPGRSGWVRIDAPAEGAIITVMPPGGGYQSWPLAIIYGPSETPVAASEGQWHDYGNDEEDARFAMEPGEFRYIAVTSDTDYPGSVDDIFLTVRRLDSGPSIGDIKDDIADAIDVFPAAESTETISETSNLYALTTEADDPTEISDLYGGDPLDHTGWLKLVVPTEASVTISVEGPPFIVTGDIDLLFFLYDEVPTASSVAIFSSDDDDPDWGSWPYLPEITLAAGTYYLAVAPFELSTWEGADSSTGSSLGTYNTVIVKVRWEAAPTIDDFSIDAIIYQTIQEPRWISSPTFIDATSASSNSAVTLSIPLPTGSMLPNDLILVFASIDMQGNSSNTVFAVLNDSGNAFSGNGLTILTRTEVATNDHALWSGWYRWNGVGDEARISTISTLSTAKAGAVLVFRNAATPLLKSSVANAAIGTGPKSVGSWVVNTNDPNYLQPILMVNAFAGGSAGPVTWTSAVGIGMTEVVDVTASANASLMVATKTDIADTFIGGGSATPSAAEFQLTQGIFITPLSTVFGIHSYIGGGLQDAWSLDAVIAGPISTQHDRTRYHYGVTPAENITGSQTYGVFPPGTTLDEILEGLDALITDLENQS